jgi:hypothetical protein
MTPSGTGGPATALPLVGWGLEFRKGTGVLSVGVGQNAWRRDW